jgi:glycosyltransferase involved in cell wall biosynthesis
MSSPDKLVSIVIPARNEESAIAATLAAMLAAVSYFENAALKSLHLANTRVQIAVVDNDSVDGTRAAVLEYCERYGVELLSCPVRKAPCARNHGARAGCGDILIFIDADTRIPENAISRIWQLVDRDGYQAGIFRMESQEPGFRSWAWWQFWNAVRMLPLARAKAMPAFMFCTRAAFEQYGPFDESVAIGEEWPILAGLYRAHPDQLIYDRSLTAYTSSRRMNLQRFGYLRIFLKYVWAVLHVSGRNGYPDSYRAVRPE